jgi:tellurite resistance protein TehA-like permease
MATGIIAVAARQQDLVGLAQGLYVVAAVAYVVLLGLTLARLVLHPRDLIADLASHTKGFAFLTLVAASNVLGSASGLVHGWWTLAWVLWWFSIGAWVVLLYSTLVSVVLRGPKPGLETGINGTWFLLTVATESIAVLGALLLARHPSDGLAFACLALFCLGLVLYLIVMTLLFLRWTFQELSPDEADPPAWIAAGAVAIIVLAGANLLGAAPVSSRVDRIAPFIEGVVTLAWATATFWFPLMVAIGVWRHVLRRVPLRYHPAYWALVFPLGMYGAATFAMVSVVDLGTLDRLPELTLAVALTAWTATFVGMVHRGVLAVTTGRR